MSFWNRRKRPKPLRRLKVDLYDRHAEHAADPSLPLCDHQSYVLLVGDTFHAEAEMSISPPTLVQAGVLDAKAEFSVRLLADDRIEIVVDLPDYLAARRAVLDAR